MGNVNVQFSDSSESAIVSYFSGPQDPSEYENLGTVDTDDARWAAFYAAMGGDRSMLPAPTGASTSDPGT
jgi:hypothetical protein